MMPLYDGISADTLFLLQLNRFNDSKLFYEEHKEEIKRGIIVPMRQIAAALSEDMLAIDPMMNTIPTKMVSRVRRDTRRTNDKTLYRDNLWIMFMRPKQEWSFYPCMWFEITQEAWSCGVGTYDANPSMMEIFRKHLQKKPDDFLFAAKSAKRAGASFAADCYKRPKPGCPSGLEDYYNAKNLFFRYESRDLTLLESDEIIKKIRSKYKRFIPMYNFLKEISDEYTAKGGAEYEYSEL